MNIQTAALYLKQGSKIRRPFWHSEDFLYANGSSVIKERVVINYIWNGADRRYEPIQNIDRELVFYLELDDLLAEDWELC